MNVMTGGSSDSSLIRQTRNLLQRYDLRAKKGLGQHFLINAGVLQKITAAAELSPTDIVLEIGPGLGVLTRALAEKAGLVIAVELDRQLAAMLRETFGVPPKDNVSVINGDILALEPLDLIQNEQSRLSAPSPEYKLVANLPYYITAPIIRHFCEARLKPQLMVIMVQKEVARNIVAHPGEMSVLAVSVQFYGRPRIVDYVPAGNFYPAPAVDSAILKIELYPSPSVSVTDSAAFFSVVRAGFCAARKQLANSLAQGLGIPKAETIAALGKAEISPKQRAEDLSLEDWARLERVLHGPTDF